MTVATLKDELKKRKLKTTGVKADLVQRLLESLSTTKEKDSGESADEQSEEEENTKPKKRKNEDSLENEPAKKISKTLSGEVGSVVDTLKDEGWKNLLKNEFEKPYFKEIEKFVAKERKEFSIYPAHEEVLNAFNFTPLNEVKVVIIGQDPYFNPKQAHGLCFSVKRGVAVPPSLNRIYNVLEKECADFVKPKHGCLEEWAKRGVLMLNATLTVRQGKANSHANCGWQVFTDEVINLLNNAQDGVIYFLWGAFAQKKGKIIDRKKHHVLECAHPSPMGGSSFNECDHFSTANELLKNMGKTPIDWTISP